MSILPVILAEGQFGRSQALVESLGDEFEMLLVTSDRDLKASSPYTDARLDAWRGSVRALGFVIFQFLLENVLEGAVRLPVIGR